MSGAYILIAVALVAIVILLVVRSQQKRASRSMGASEGGAETSVSTFEGSNVGGHRTDPGGKAGDM